MGESSAPRRPTHDTNTSRREVKITHTHDNNTSSKQSKYKYTMKFTRLIASTLMLLVVLMASTASARSIASPEPQKFCCNAISARCEACKAGVSVEEICRTWVVDSSDPLSFHSRPLSDVLRSSQRHAAELTLWSAKLVSQMSQRKNSAEGSLTHMSALRRSNAAELTLWSAKLVSQMS